MKNTTFIGLMALTATLAFSSAHAAGKPGAKGFKEALTEYTETVKLAAFGKGKTAEGLSAQAIESARNTLINELKISGSQSNALSQALSGSGEVVTKRMNNMAVIVAAKKISTEISKQDAGEGQSIDASANAMAKWVANSPLIGARKAGKDLSAAEMAEVSTAMSKIDNLQESILTKFSKDERDSFTQVMNEHNKLVENGAKGSSEEAFIQAIMNIKQVDRAKALEIARKLKDCV